MVNHGGVLGAQVMLQEIKAEGLHSPAVCTTRHHLLGLLKECEEYERLSQQLHDQVLHAPSGTRMLLSWLQGL